MTGKQIDKTKKRQSSTGATGKAAAFKKASEAPPPPEHPLKKQFDEALSSVEVGESRVLKTRDKVALAVSLLRRHLLPATTTTVRRLIGSGSLTTISDALTELLKEEGSRDAAALSDAVYLQVVKLVGVIQNEAADALRRAAAEHQRVTSELSAKLEKHQAENTSLRAERDALKRQLSVIRNDRQGLASALKRELAVVQKQIDTLASSKTAGRVRARTANASAKKRKHAPGTQASSSDKDKVLSPRTKGQTNG